MKKILLLTMVCGLGLVLLPGCTTRISTSIKTCDVAHPVRPLPLTADLNISEQKVRAEAEGEYDVKKDREGKEVVRVAVARALGQDPPKPEAADVLVAMNVYKELKGGELKVVVTGYPAWYRNFRSVEPGDSAWLILANTKVEAFAMSGGGGALRLGASGQNTQAAGKSKAGSGARFGFHAEPRFNFLSIEQNKHEYINKSGFGWAFGLALKIPITDEISVNPLVNFKMGNMGTRDTSYSYNDVYYDRNGPKQDKVDVSSKDVYSEMGISVPVFAQYTLPVGYPVYVEAGIQLDVNFLTEVKWERKVESSYNGSDTDDGTRDIYDDRSAVDFGWGFGVGYMVLPGLNVGMRWVFNFNDTFDFGSSGPETSLSTLSFGVTYTF